MNTTILQLVAISIEDKNRGKNNSPRQGTIQELKLLLHRFDWGCLRTRCWGEYLDLGGTR